MLSLIISLISGAAGGNLAGTLLKKHSLGTLWNSVAGIVGGGLGAQLLGMMGVATSGGMDVAGIISTIASGGVGGGVLMLIVSLVKGMLSK